MPGEKHLEPTPHRRQQARKEGQVARSHDLVSAVLLLLGLVALMATGRGLIEFLGRYTAGQLGHETWHSTNPALVQAHFEQVLGGLGRHLLPLFGLLMLGAIVSQLGQVGFLFLPEKVAPDLGRISPMRGLQRIFSVGGWSRLGFGLLKIVIIGAVAWFDIYAQRDAILGLSGLSIWGIASLTANVLLWCMLKIGLALLVLSVLDYGVQRWKHEQDLKMSTQELREEMRNLEGNPEIRSRRKRLQQQWSAGRVARVVPTADLILSGPGGVAVAIRYDSDTMGVPVVVAKGIGTTARRIGQLALEHDVPVVEKGPLAQVLHHDVDTGDAIPAEQYAAVAQVLAGLKRADKAAA